MNWTTSARAPLGIILALMIGGVCWGHRRRETWSGSGARSASPAAGLYIPSGRRWKSIAIQ